MGWRWRKVINLNGGLRAAQVNADNCLFVVVGSSPVTGAAAGLDTNMKTTGGDITPKHQSFASLLNAQPPEVQLSQPFLVRAFSHASSFPLPN